MVDKHLDGPKQTVFYVTCVGCLTYKWRLTKMRTQILIDYGKNLSNADNCLGSKAFRLREALLYINT